MIDKIPLAFREFIAAIPDKRHIRRRHLLTLFAQLFTLARHQRVEEILKVAVAGVVPAILAAEAQQPLWLRGEQIVAGRIGKVDMGTA